MRAVEKHERDWGSESYTGRPTLTQILDAPVVAFWHPSGSDPDMRTTITLHDDINDISAYVTQLVLHTTRERLPLVRLWRVFKGKREVKIKGVKVDFEYVGGG